MRRNGKATQEFDGRNIRPETFAVLLVQHIPAHVRLKLEGWGVLDFCALFRRAIGLHAVFSGYSQKPKIFRPSFCAATIAISTNGTSNGSAIGFSNVLNLTNTRLNSMPPANTP